MNKIKKHFGFVSIVGRANVGKSSLLNKIFDRKISIVSHVPQTTRYQIKAVLTDKDKGQIVFLDTPGLYVAKDILGKYMRLSLNDAQEAADLVYYVVDVLRSPGDEEIKLMHNLAKLDKPLIMILNKIDKADTFLSKYILLWKELNPKRIPEYFIPTSATTGFNIDKLVNATFSLLPQGEEHYNKNTSVDFPKELAVADIIREKLLLALKQELPHSLAVVIDEFTKRNKKLVYIRSRIIVERPSQKEIVIGKKAAQLKKIGVAARKDIERRIKKMVFLEINVSVNKKWRDDPEILKKLRYVS